MKTKDAALQLQRATTELAGAFGYMAEHASSSGACVDEWEAACEALRELLAVATAQHVHASHAKLLVAELAGDQSAAQ